MLNTFSKILSLLIFLSPSLQAQLVPINENELADMTGQAFVNIDNSSAGGLDFTKVTLGLDVKTLLNSDVLEFGRYERTGELRGSSDIRISDFALGGIDSNGNIVPFEIKDPFVELAFEDNGGKQDLVGVRLGFGGAKGALSGTIESLTGNVNVEIRDTAAGLKNGQAFLAKITSVFFARSPIETTAKLVDSSGNLDRVRAELIGIPNGDVFSIFAGSGLFETDDRAALRFLDWIGLGDCKASSTFGGCTQLDLTANNCQTLGINVCFDLKLYNTLDVGKKQNDGTFDFAEGLFLGFQTKPITWKDGSTTTPTESGAFLNVPNGGLEVTLHQAFLGTNRVRTRYVDPYFGGR